VFGLKRFMLQPRFDVNQSLQVETDGMHNFFAFGPDLHDGDHVKLHDKLASFRFKLPSIRRILPSLVDDHVKFAWNFLARTRSRQTLPGTSLRRRNQVVIQASRSLLAVFLGMFGFTLVAKLTGGRFLGAGLRNLWWANAANSCRNARCLCLVYVQGALAVKDWGLESGQYGER